MFHERHPRTLLKSITWMILAYIVTLLTLWLIEGDWEKATWHAFLVQLVKVAFFYAHERLWNKSNYGQELKVTKK